MNILDTIMHYFSAMMDFFQHIISYVAMTVVTFFWVFLYMIVSYVDGPRPYIQKLAHNFYEHQDTFEQVATRLLQDSTLTFVSFENAQPRDHKDIEEYRTILKKLKIKSIEKIGNGVTMRIWRAGRLGESQFLEYVYIQRGRDVITFYDDLEKAIKHNRKRDSFSGCQRLTDQWCIYFCDV